jgi:hypothetical protein
VRLHETTASLATSTRCAEMLVEVVSDAVVAVAECRFAHH